MFGNPASSKIGLKCFFTKCSSRIGCPKVVMKMSSLNRESPLWSDFRLCAFMFCNMSRTHVCSLITRRLRLRFTSSKTHSPSTLCRVRTTLAVPFCQLMSGHDKARYSLGRIPLVRATANKQANGEFRAVLRNSWACAQPVASQRGEPHGYIARSAQKVGDQSYFGMPFVFPREQETLELLCQSTD